MPVLESNLRPVWVEPTGITVLHEPANQLPKADLLFVHGLQGHPWRTWRHKRKGTVKSSFPRTPLSRVVNPTSQPDHAGSSTQRVYWPGQLVPSTCSGIRVLTYGYDSHVSKWFSGPTNKMTMSQHALSLLNDLSLKRQDCRGRPLIFVAHSLGGLVVKTALVESQKQRYHEQLHEIYTSCEGIIFFGTPHRGSGAAKWGVLLSNIASAVQFDTHKEILKDLDPSSNSHILEELRRDFNDILEQGRIQIHTFQEGKGVSGLKIANEKIVPDESSSFESRKFEVKDTINANHMDMCRFEMESDDGYQKFAGALANFMRRIDERARHIDGRTRTERRNELLHSLEFAERRAREEQLSNDDDTSTFDWVWSAQSQGQTFTEWLTGSTRLFWISGKPGSGKSTLMNHLSHHGRTHTLLCQSSNLKWVIIRFFFDFRQGKGVANAFEGLLRALLVQIVQNVPDLTVRVLEFGKDGFDEKDALNWSEAKLRRTLLDSLRASPCNICIFVDGLDEYEGNTLHLLKLLMEIGNSCATLPHSVKLCLASRPEPLLSVSLEGSPGLRMQDHNIQGIEQYVSSTMRLLPAAADDEEFADLSQEIATRSEGVFLWARLAMNDLVEGFAYGESHEKLLDRLQQVPRGLQDVYTRIFNRLTDVQRAEANTILLLVCQAKRSLQLSELHIATATAETQDQIYDEEELSALTTEAKSLRRRIIARSRGLLEVTQTSESKWYVKIVHETVRAFVETQQGILFSAPQIGELIAPHVLWLRACVTTIKATLPSVITSEIPCYDTNGDYIRGPLRYLKSSIMRRFPLWNYAAKYIFDHARDLEEIDGISSYDLLHNLIGSDLHHFHRMASTQCRWCEVVLLDEVKSLFDTGPSTWPWAILHGLPKYCESSFCYEKPPSRYQHTIFKIVLIPYEKYRYLRWLASPVPAIFIKATASLISVLMKQGVRVCDGNIVQALRTAPPGVLQVLLQDRTPGGLHLQASIGDFGGPFWTLMSADYTGFYFRNTVDYLIRRGEDINDTSGPAGTALHAFLWNLSSHLPWRYEILLKRGANPNVRGPAGPPLALAWKRAIRGRLSPLEIVEYQIIMTHLLDFGARIDWVDDDGCTPSEQEIRAYCASPHARYICDRAPLLRICPDLTRSLPE